ncbi:FadR/GntR family transcriptional regulator [Microbacterium sp. 22303]|uniref:FadR/GntR family transcriptional regulator n=1 Tax=Microbacterium sp. 22303 TaxID=3453905 RepID=UPI003F82DE8B
MELDMTSTRIPDSLAAALRARIHMGEFQPGERFPSERELADQFGVSRVTLREALRILQDEGYVEIRRGPYGGAYVTDLSEPVQAWRTRMIAESAALDELFDFRIGIEMATTRFAALRRTADDLELMRATIEELRKVRTQGEFRVADSRFHAAVASAARSSRLSAAVRQLRGELFTPLDILDLGVTPDEDADQHEAIFDAIRARDADIAEARMCAHIERTRATFKTLLAIKPTLVP